MADGSLVTLLTDPLVLSVLAVLAFVCYLDWGKRKREVDEYNQDPAAYRELQRQGKRR